MDPFQYGFKHNTAPLRYLGQHGIHFGNLQGIITICHSKERSPFALLAAITHSRHMFTGDTIYGHDMVHDLELVKPNLCKNIESWHHDSCGGINAFGTKAS